MKITSKGEYATKAVLYLTLRHPDIVPIQEIAQRHHIPLKYLEQILLTLKNAGVLRSRRGIKGGYQLGRPPEEITVGEVLTIVDGRFAQASCPEPGMISDYTCPDLDVCGLKSLWVEVQTAVETILNGTTFAQLRERSGAAAQRQAELVQI